MNYGKIKINKLLKETTMMCGYCGEDKILYDVVVPHMFHTGRSRNDHLVMCKECFLQMCHELDERRVELIQKENSNGTEID